MLTIHTDNFTPPELVGALFSWPPFSLAFAVLIAGGIALTSRGRARARAHPSTAVPRAVRKRYEPEHRSLRIAATAIIALFLVEFILRGYVLTGPEIWWWRFALPIAFAVIGIGAVCSLIVTRGTTPPEVPVAPSSRRSWSSFSARSTLIAAAVAFGVLVATTVAAGLASTPNGEGQYLLLTIPVLNETSVDPIVLPFYGWMYGVPVLVGLAALLPVVWATLDRNAARPYLRPESVATERTARRETARGAVLIPAAAMLLTLGGAWRLIASAGSGWSLTVAGANGNVHYDVPWRYSELAVAAGWFAPFIEVAALTILLLIAAGLLGLKAVSRESTPTETLIDTEVR